MKPRASFFDSYHLFTFDGTGAIHARYDYDPYGRVTKVSGDMDSDFTYAGYYNHAPSGLNLTLYRAYSADLGRWLGRDPIGEKGGINLYGYVVNDPIDSVDPNGEAPTDWATQLNGYINTAQAFYTTDQHWGWNGIVDTGSDLLRGLSDVLRFGDGTGNAFYDPCLSGVERGVAVLQDVLRGSALVSAGSAIALRGGAWLGGTRIGNLLNENRYLRLGPGNTPRGAAMSRGAGQNTPRLSIGNGKPISGRNHFDLRFFGF